VRAASLFLGRSDTGTIAGTVDDNTGAIEYRVATLG